MKRRWSAALVAGIMSIGIIGAAVTATGAKAKVPAREYVVLAERGASDTAVRAAVKRAGGQVVRSNPAIGLYTVSSRRGNFVRAATATAALRSAGRNRPFGRSFSGTHKRFDPLSLSGAKLASRDGGRHGGDDDGDEDEHRGRGGEPLAHLQWDMQMIGATKRQAHREERGDHKVLVGVIDSGIDASHPDIAPNFDRGLSRNFTTDIPGLDKGCVGLPAPCVDPVDIDGDTVSGHGTHVAGTIAAAANDLGIAGVAPKVTLVNLRAGQDSGFFFLQPTLDALTYAADNGIDVVNMSYFTDPWLYNCRSNPADSPAERAEQSLIIDATQRAADYARARGVTLVAALGNEWTDLGNPTFDPLNPQRPVDNSCVNVPAETNGVISVSAVGPSGAKAEYSNYGTEQTDLAAPGGFLADLPGTPASGKPANLILSTYPAAVAAVNGELNSDGTPNTPRVIRDCDAQGICGYYQYIDGTSMASPHVAGVAALIVSKYGSTRHGRGISMDPVEVERILRASATDTPCPTPPLFDYTRFGLEAKYNALCVGTPQLNGFYGDGIVNAQAAVGRDDDHRGDRDDD